MRKIVIIAMCLLSACALPKPINRAEVEIKECIALGFKPGTTEFAKCRLQVRSIEMQRTVAVFSAYRRY